MKFALTVAAIVAPTLVLSAPVTNPRLVNDSADTDIDIGSLCASLHPCQIGDPRPSFQKHDDPEWLEELRMKFEEAIRDGEWPKDKLPGAEVTKSKSESESEFGTEDRMMGRKRGLSQDADLPDMDMTPVEILTMPGPVIPADDLPSIAPATTQIEEKRSEDVTHSPPDTILEAPHRIPYPSDTADKIQKYWNTVNPGDRKVYPADFHCVHGSKKEECREARFPSPWEYEHSKGKVAGIVDTDDGCFRHPANEECQDKIYDPLEILYESEAPMNEDLSRREMYPSEVFRMPGPIIPQEELPEVTETEGHLEDKRSEELVMANPTSSTEALLVDCVRKASTGQELRECVSEIHRSALGLSGNTIIEDVR